MKPTKHAKRFPKQGKQNNRNHQQSTDVAFNAKFQQHVEKLSKILRLTDSAKATGPRLFKEGAGGTLEQVGREADNAMEGVKRIMALLNVEGKAADYQLNVAVGWAGAIYNLSANISQGVGDAQRTGDSLKTTRVRAKLYFNYATADGAITVVIGRSKDGVPSIGDIFDSVGTIYSGISFENHDQRKADQWLWHRTLVINSVDHKGAIVECDLKGLDVDTTYVNATTAVSAGCYWIAWISNQVASGAVYSNVRLDFVDN